ncbi:lysylphosphatidylglycerol synthase transmembrane domain-containing protein [Bacteroidota bacterium]
MSIFTQNQWSVLFLLTIFFNIREDNEFQIKELWAALKSINYFWIIISFCLAILSHVIRALRWNMLIEPLGKKPEFLNTFLSVLIMYLANFALPRMGEVSRCGVLKKYENVSFTKLLGTVLVERSVDFLILVLLFVIVFFTQLAVLQEFVQNYSKTHGAFVDTITSKFFYLYVIGLFGVFAIVFYMLRKRFSGSWVFTKVNKIINDFSEGLKSILKMKKKGLFLLYTFLIYLLYFLMTYVVFFCFDFSKDLSLSVALTIVVMGSIGMIVMQGGIGAYHFLVMETLFIYGIDKFDGKLFALVMHGGNTIGMVIIGFIALIILPIYNRNRTLKNNTLSG